MIAYRGIGFEKRGKKKRKLTEGLSSVFQRIGFKKLSGRYSGHWTVEYEDEFSVSINFLKQKYGAVPALTRAIMTDFSVAVFTMTFVKLLLLA